MVYAGPECEQGGRCPAGCSDGLEDVLEVVSVGWHYR